MIGLPFEHSWLGLEAWWPGKIKQNTKSSSSTWSTWQHLPPGSLHQRGQVWSPGPVLPGVRLLHDGEQHDDDELARDHPGDAALEEGLPLNLQQSRPGRDTLSNFCRLLISGAKPNMAMFSTANCFQEVAEICFLRLNLLLVAVEARKYEGGSIDINPNGKKITPNAIGLFISDSSDKVKRAWFYCRLVFEAKKLHYSILIRRLSGCVTRTSKTSLMWRNALARNLPRPATNISPMIRLCSDYFQGEYSEVVLTSTFNTHSRKEAGRDTMVMVLLEMGENKNTPED